MILTNDRRKLQQEIEFFTPKRGTVLYDAICLGAERSANVPDRPALAILTDGVDENADQNGLEASGLLKKQWTSLAVRKSRFTRSASEKR